MFKLLNVLMITLLLVFPFAGAQGAQLLMAEQLIRYCDDTSALSTPGNPCTLYVQGFINGAVATDARVMLNMEAEKKQSESYSERAIRTRAPSRGEYLRAAKYAEFCLGSTIRLKQIVTHVANEIKMLSPTSGLTAAEAVYGALKKHYPCA